MFIQVGSRTDGAPAHVTRRYAAGHQQIVQLPRQDCSKRNLSGEGLLVQHDLALVERAGEFLIGTGVDVDVPFGYCDGIGVDGRSARVDIECGIVLGKDVTAHQAPGLPGVDLVRAMAVVDKLVGREPPILHALAPFLRPDGPCARNTGRKQRVPVFVHHALPISPGTVHVSALSADQLRPIDADFTVGQRLGGRRRHLEARRRSGS